MPDISKRTRGQKIRTNLEAAVNDRLVLPWLKIDVFQDGLLTEEPQGCLPGYLIGLDAMWKPVCKSAYSTRKITSTVMQILGSHARSVVASASVAYCSEAPKRSTACMKVVGS